MKYSTIKVCFLLLSFACVEAIDKRGFLSAESSNGMQPALVAHTLVQVEDEWRAQVHAFNECNASLAEGEDMNECMSASKAFHKSCTTIVNAVVESSSGDRANVAEYMEDVCGEKELQGWRLETCHSLASLITDKMSADAYANRQSIDGTSLCNQYWSTFSESEKAWEQKEAEERAAEEKRIAEERAEEEKRKAEQAAEEQKRKELEEAEKQAQEEAEMIAEQKKKEQQQETVAAANASEAQPQVSQQNASDMQAATEKAAANATAAKPASFLSMGHRLQPELVAHTFFEVSNEWRSQAQAFNECNASNADGEDMNMCMSAVKAFRSSCSKVVDAVLQSSSGDRSRVVEYTEEVCAEKELQNWRQENCNNLASLIVDSMSADAYDNREKLDGSELCNTYWSKFSEKERVWAEQDRAEREAEEKREAEARAEEEKRAKELAAKEAEEKQRRKEEEEQRAAQQTAEKAAEDQKRREVEEAQKQEDEEMALKAQQSNQTISAVVVNNTTKISNSTKKFF